MYELVVTELLDGMKPGELARSLGVAPSWVSDRLKEFRTELCFANGVFPPVDDETYEALRESIAENGVLVPIVVDEYGEIIDGHARSRAARQLGIECPREIHYELNQDERRRITIALNASRRHLTRAEKQALVVSELMYNGSRSDREIGRVVGVSPSTVGKFREQLRVEGEVFDNVEPDEQDLRLAENLSTASKEQFVGEAECPCCAARLRGLKRAGVGFLLELAPVVAAAA